MRSVVWPRKIWIYSWEFKLILAAEAPLNPHPHVRQHERTASTPLPHRTASDKEKIKTAPHQHPYRTASDKEKIKTAPHQEADAYAECAV